MTVGDSFAEFLDVLPDAILVSDHAGTITYVNRQAEALSGYPRAELIGRSIEELVPGRLRSEHERHRHDYVGDAPRARPMGTGLDIRFRRKDGSEFPADIALGPVQTERGPLVVAAVRDLTEHRRLDAELREAGERERLLQDRERIGRELHDGAIQGLFAIGLSLQGAAELLGEGTQVQRRLEDSVLQIDAVIRDLRNYVFQLRPDALSVHGLEQALRGIAAEFERETGVATRVDLALQGDQPGLSTHGGDLLQLVREALSNVARHAQAGDCRLGLHGADRQLVLEIGDDGCGFDVNRPAARGWGLRNLRERASAMGGRLEIVSAPGRGTTVRLRVP